METDKKCAVNSVQKFHWDLHWETKRNYSRILSEMYDIKIPHVLQENAFQWSYAEVKLLKLGDRAAQESTISIIIILQ